MRHNLRLYGYLAALLAAHLSLLLPPAHPLRVGGALLLITLLPGLGWAVRLEGQLVKLQTWVLAAALSYIFTSVTVLLLHYWPGPVEMGPLLVGLDLLALLGLVLPRRLGYFGEREISAGDSSGLDNPDGPAGLTQPTRSPWLGLGLLLLIALFLRAANLNYSEFQGDEALAMIAAAEALEGHEDALFLRSKGPGEVLLPMALWRLTGTTGEALSRLPFTLASLWAIVTLYLIGERLGSGRLGVIVAGFFAFNGFMVAFGRIVQYQALVVWLSALAFLLLIEWRRRERWGLAALSGLCLGAGLLAHYDAILVLPALGWLLLPRPFSLNGIKRSLLAGGGFLGALLLVALPFYGPYLLDPQAGRTGDYVGGRIGNELRNNLPDFFHFNSFYSSSYYLILTGLLVLAWLTWRASRLNRPVALALLAAVLLALFRPELFVVGESLNLTFLPFALLFLLALLRFPLASTGAALLLWLAVPFLGYNFVVALGLTHIYTVVPAWSLLAALAWVQGFERARWPLIPLRPALVSGTLLGLGLLLATLFLWNSFVRHDVEYWQDYPAGNLPWVWTPYADPPQAGFFGFAHRAGWKAVGQKIVAGELAGDYGSNEEPDITTWYTRGAPRACDPQPEFYFLADDLIDPVPVPVELIESHYQAVGTMTLPNRKEMRILQQVPASLAWGPLDEAALAREFDRSAVPAAFARSARGSIKVEANFEGLVRLVGYDVDLRRAQPGGRVPVTLYWQALAAIPASYQVFTHLEGGQGPVAQADGVPVCWSYPTDLWRPGQIIADQHAIPLSPDVSPGEYPLEIGLYLPETFERLDLLDVAGNPAGTSLRLTTVKIGDLEVERQ